MAPYILLFILITAVAFLMFVSWKFNAHPAMRWKCRVVGSLAELRQRIRAASASLSKITAQCQDAERAYLHQTEDSLLNQKEIYALKGFPGIGEGTITKLVSYGRNSVGSVYKKSISISGFGDKRLSDIQAAAESIAEEVRAQIQSSHTTRSQLEQIRSKFEGKRLSLEQSLGLAAQVRGFLEKLEPEAKRITLFNFILNGLELTVPPPHLNATWPAIATIFVKDEPENSRLVSRNEPIVQAARPNLTATPQNRTPEFIGPGKSIAIAGRQFNEPFIYVADCARLAGFDASLLALRCRIEPPRVEPPKALGYWPQLSELQPHQIGNYLQWHATGRCDPNVDLGYVFIFFYGLERRALVDNQDAVPIAYEVIRLLGIYKHSRSFCSYATNFVSYLALLGRIRLSAQLVTKLFEFQDRYIEEGLLNVILGYLAKNAEALPADWARRLAVQDERAKRSVVVSRDPELFTRVFAQKYNEMMGSGIKVSSTGQYAIHYRAASPSLLSSGTSSRLLPIAHWPTVLDWRTQFSPAVAAWNTAIDDVKKQTRRKKAVEESATFSTQEDTEHPLQSTWDALLAELAARSGAVLLPISRIAPLANIPVRSRLTLGQSKMLSTLAENLGTPLEPDARYTGKSYSWNEQVAAIKLIEEPVLPQGRGYQLAALLLQLALEISEADGATSTDERLTINEFLEERFMLGPNERHRLYALTDVLLVERSPISSVFKGIDSSFNETQRQSIGRFLVEVANATNGIETSERAALKRVFKGLSLEEHRVDLYASEIHLPDEEAPVSIQAEGEEDNNDEPIPSKPSVDLERIRRLRAESDDVAKMLVSAMTAVVEVDADEPALETKLVVASVQTEPATTSSTVNTQPVVAQSVLFLLRESLRPLVIELVKKESWPLSEADTLARKYGTSWAAAVEQINEWSDEHLGDFLIEDGNPLTVNSAIYYKAGGTT